MNFEVLKEQLNKVGSMEVEVPDLTSVSEYFGNVVDEIIGLVESLPDEDKKRVLSDLVLIADNDEHASDLLRDIADIILKYGKTDKLLDIAHIYKFVADSMDFVDEILYTTIETLFGIEELESFREMKSELLKDRDKLKEEILSYWVNVYPQTGGVAGWTRNVGRKYEDTGLKLRN